MLDQDPIPDRRGAMRWRCSMGVNLSWRGGELQALSSDISTSGVFVETAERIPRGTDVQLALELFHDGRPRPVEAQGLVTRVTSGEDAGGLTGLGIHFESFQRGQQVLAAVLGELAVDRALTDPEQDAPATGMERRRSSREPTGIKVRWGVDEPTNAGYISDLSDQGAFVLHTAEPCAQGTRLVVEFDISLHGELQTVHADATAVRLKALSGMVHGMGLMFDLSTVDVRRLAAFLESRRRAGRSELQHPPKPRRLSPGLVAALVCITVVAAFVAALVAI